MSQTVALKGQWVRKERAAEAAITPGHLVEITATGTVQAHGTAAQASGVQAAFAVENDVFGEDIATDYAADDRVQYNVFAKGSEVNAIVAAGETITIGDLLESAGDGTLQEATTGQPVAIALEAGVGQKAVEIL